MQQDSVFFILLSAILVNNFVLGRFLALCSFMGLSRKIDTALGMGLAVIFVMAMAGAVSWLINAYLLVPNELEFLQTIVFILIIAVLVQLTEMVIRKSAPSLYQALGIYLPLITTNCAILAVAVINVREDFGFVQAVVNSVGGAVGYMLAIIIFAGIRERQRFADIPESLQGFSNAFITTALLSIGFLGFSGFLSGG